VALLVLGPAAGARAEPADLDTLVVPEPPPLTTRTPTEDIRRLLRPEASIIEARNRLDKSIADRSERLDELRDLDKRLETDLAAETQGFEAKSAALESNRQLVKTRLALLARSKRSSALADLLPSGADAPSFSAFEQRRSARDLLELADRERIRIYAATVADWEIARDDLERRKTNLARTKETIARLEQELAWDREEQTALRAAVVEEPEFYAAYAQEMEKLDELMADKVKILAPEDHPERRRLYMEETRGGLAPPIRNYEVVGGFGTRNYKGILSVWRGAHFIPLHTPRGDGPTEVRAIYWGWVAWTGWIAGLGRVVIVDHTMGYASIYCHLGSIDVEVGVKVKTGEVLGAMGDSESFFGKRLYMELRRDGVALNPLPWLR
jgi:septal ring factor EnvC (AmiA/AmiB activator)